MKNNVLKKVSALVLSFALVLSCLAATVNFTNLDTSAIEVHVTLRIKSHINNVPNNILDTMEELGGHTIARHVAKSGDFLIKRASSLRAEGASSYLSKDLATKATQYAIKENADLIMDWLENSSNNRYVFKTTIPYTIGHGVLRKTSKIIEDLDKINMVLEKNINKDYGFKIITTYPLFK